MKCFSTKKNSTPINVITQSEYKKWVTKQSAFSKAWLKNKNYQAKPLSSVVIPDEKAGINKVLLVVESKDVPWNFAALVKVLPKGHYEFHGLSMEQYRQAAIAWGMESYQYTKYKQRDPIEVYLTLPASIKRSVVDHELEAIYLVRDLMNTPADDMGPSELALAAKKVAKEYQAQIKVIVGDQLLKQNYPTIHAVGRGCDDAPRLIDLTWGKRTHPKITLVGKGVCFDTGGLDLKSASGMLSMKKDMGGAAHVLGLAQWIMAEQLPVRLRMLIPAVENSVSANSYHPGDIIKTRKGLTVEVTNTDAEGRLVLCDALDEACREKPEVLIDFATLTGAARVALGTEIAAMFANEKAQAIAKEFWALSEKLDDPVWPMPLYTPYERYLKSELADMVNSVLKVPYGGAITAGLYLKAFVDQTIPWIHFDIMGANLDATPGKPVGADASALRVVAHWLKKTYVKS